jgi:hypothetical protein
VPPERVAQFEKLLAESRTENPRFPLTEKRKNQK